MKLLGQNEPLLKLVQVKTRFNNKICGKYIFVDDLNMLKKNVDIALEKLLIILIKINK